MILVLPGIHQYLLLDDFFIGCHTQYSCSSDILMPVAFQLPADDGRETGDEVKYIQSPRHS